ncbi:MAG: DUF5320 domain-containing protein [Conexivisphaera sp.]
MWGRAGGGWHGWRGGCWGWYGQPYGWDPAYWGPYAGYPYPSPQSELAYLESYARQLEDELSRVRARIDELKKGSR